MQGGRKERVWECLCCGLNYCADVAPLLVSSGLEGERMTYLQQPVTALLKLRFKEHT